MRLFTVRTGLSIFFFAFCIGISSSASGISRHFDTTSKPVIRHNKYSKYPNRIQVQGRIVQISYGTCGILCFGATVKVELTHEPKGYKGKFLYMVVPCLELPPKDSLINVLATKLYYKEKECYYQDILNVIDSKGKPFYKISEKEAAKIE
ncbi:MAG: hypothetical protein EOO53_20505 [Gammaproteobacteria bacterium]|nr:MAG: hypothetical protein EOO53_20505 [Gammaproteobacteria bacterium]